MKILIIGIDGGDYEIIRRMPMPFVNAFVNNNISLQLQEDLLSRGWVEMLTGKHASETNAFYLRPLADGTHRFTDRYGVNEIANNIDVVPVWDLLNKNGFSVGIQNIPTTNPAPVVNGFIVSGGGGGLDVGTGVPPSMYYPAEVGETLAKGGYVFDVRFNSSGVSTIRQLVDLVNEVYIGQTRTYLNLCQQYKPDLGFLCYRITTALQYLSMSEIVDYMREYDQAKQEGREPKAKNPTQAELIKHYTGLDACIKNICESMRPDHLIFVSDHGSSAYRQEFNSDIFLEKSGYLTRKNLSSSIMAELIVRVKKHVPKALKRVLKKTKAGQKIKIPISGVDLETARAFGTFFDCGNFAGIYINDEKRFGGPVKTSEVDALCEEICSKFNADEVVCSYNMRALPYRNMYSGLKHQDVLPDIKIIKPDYCYFTNRRDVFVCENLKFTHLPQDLTSLTYPNSGVKGSRPFFCMDKFFDGYLANSEELDLRVLYKVIQKWVDNQTRDMT